jgi:hypothetical protein
LADCKGGLEGDCGDERTVKENNKSAEAAWETIAAVQELLAVARDTVKPLAAADRTVAAAAELVAAAKETIEVTERAPTADERDRKVRQLRDIGQLAGTLF